MHLPVTQGSQPIQDPEHVVGFPPKQRSIQHDRVGRVEEVAAVRLEELVLAAGVGPRFPCAARVAGIERGVGFVLEQLADQRLVAQFRIARQMRHVQHGPRDASRRARHQRLVRQTHYDRLDVGFRLHRVMGEVPLGVLASGQGAEDAIVRQAFARRELQHRDEGFAQRRVLERLSAAGQLLRFLFRERVDGPWLRFQQLAARRARQRLVLLQYQGRLAFRVGDAGHPVEPLVHRFAVFARVAVVSRTDEHGDVLFGPQQPVQPLQPRKSLFCPPDVEVVLFLLQNDHRLGRQGGQEVFVIESQGQGSRRTLLGVLRQFILQVATERGDEATGRRHGPALLPTAQPRGQGAAARVAREAHVPWIDLTAGQQVVERPDAIPGAPRAEEFADQVLLIAGDQVFVYADADTRLEIFARVLQTLALADGVVDQHNISQPRQSLGERLIRIVGLPVTGMPATSHHAGQRELAALGQIQVGGDGELRPALEDRTSALAGIQ